MLEQKITNVTARPIPTADFEFFDTPRNGHTPRNLASTILLISTAEIIIEKIFIIIYSPSFLRFFLIL